MVGLYTIRSNDAYLMSKLLLVLHSFETLMKALSNCTGKYSLIFNVTIVSKARVVVSFLTM